MRQIMQGTPKKAETTPNAKYLVIRGRKVEAVYFPANMTPSQVRDTLVARQEIADTDRVILA